MRLERVLFDDTVFDPKTSVGADNTRKFYSAADDYVIDLDVTHGVVRVFHPSRGRHNLVPWSRVKEARALESADAGPMTAVVAPTRQPVKVAEGQYKIEPIEPVSDPESDPVTEPVKRTRGRPRKIAA